MLQSVNSGLVEVLMGVLFVGLGGALGAIGRYAISLIPVKNGFPILTLITNAIGAVLIGFVLENRRLRRFHNIFNIFPRGILPV